jgi:hypothetical protein
MLLAEQTVLARGRMEVRTIYESSWKEAVVTNDSRIWLDWVNHEKLSSIRIIGLPPEARTQHLRGKKN